MDALNAKPRNAASDLPLPAVRTAPGTATTTPQPQQGQALLRDLVAAMARQAAREEWARTCPTKPFQQDPRA